MADFKTRLMVAIVAMVFGVCHFEHSDASAETQDVQRAGPEDKGDCDFNPTDPISIVTHHNDGNYWGIGGKKHWKLSTDNKVEREASPYNNVPDDLDAGFSIVWHRNPYDIVEYSYLFKGKEYWRVSNNKLSEDFPKIIKYHWGRIEDIDATLKITRSKAVGFILPLLYFFKGSQYWQYDTAKDHMEEGYPRSISDYWDGLPNDLDGALEAPNGDHYFLKGGQYYKLMQRGLTYAIVEKVDPPFARC